MNDTPSEQHYLIGAVAKLTSITPQCLRAWERRYGLGPSYRTRTQRRLYTQEDVQRLMLIKRLVDAGNTISSIAYLSLDQLQERIRETNDRSILPSNSNICRYRMAVFGFQLAEQLRAHSNHGLNVVAVYNRPSEADLDVLEADVLILEHPTVHREEYEEVLRLLDRTGARKAVVVYRFVHPDVANELNTARIMGLQAPIDLNELQLACLEPLGRIPNGDENANLLPMRRFDDIELARIASQSSLIKCQCPHHLVNLLLSLTAFEDYSARCENQTTDDAQIHAYLRRITAQARAKMEQALNRVIDHEGIS